MSNKDFDLLAKAAFGESDLSEDRLIEEWLAQDAQAQEQHTQFVALKEGLRSLADVPECQLSSERLRDAILSQGVKPVRTTTWLKWAAPALVAASLGLFAIYGLPKTPASNTPVAVNSNTPND